jgi:hypothetical protein
MAVLALMAATAWRRLVARDYSRATAGVIVALALAQSAICLGGSSTFSAAFLGLGVYAVSASAFSLAREQSVRGIIRAGSALAGAQLIMPFGGLFTAAILPALIVIPKSPKERGKSLGVFVLLLFMPALSAISIWAMHVQFPIAATPSGLSIRDSFSMEPFFCLVPRWRLPVSADRSGQA